jgi:hypothetical protein
LRDAVSGAADDGRNSPCRDCTGPLAFLCGLFTPLNQGGRAESDAKAAALPIVRLILGITLLLLGVGTLSCRIERTARSSPDITAAWQWVRTVDGWERPEMWCDAPHYVPRLHPLVVALEEGLLSVLGLVACQRDESSGV